jgi:[ribosomal protein S5]-alanine N-acetyltransferase
MVETLILETSRLMLCKFNLQDAASLERVLGDRLAMEYYPAPLDRTGVESWVKRNMERYERDGHGLWAMRLKKSGELIGDCGCVRQEVEGNSHIEIGYHVRRDLWGHGYGTEAAYGCMEYAFQQLGAARVVSMIRPENLRSIRVAEKNGMQCDKIVFWRGYNHCIYAKSRALL